MLTLNLRFNYSIKEEGREGRVDKQQPDNHTPPPRNFSRGENIELKGGGKIEGFVEAISSSPQIWKRFEGVGRGLKNLSAAYTREIRNHFL